MNTLVAVFLGGGIGSLFRYGVSRLSLHYFASVFPWATLISNLISSLILAILMMYYADKMQDSSLWRAFLIIGFCGGFSTFSTFGYETFVLMKSNHYLFAFLNVLISVVAALLIMYLVIRNQ